MVKDKNKKQNEWPSLPPGQDAYIRDLEQTLLNREWLKTRTKFELIDLVMFQAVHLYKQSTTELQYTAARRKLDAVFLPVTEDNLPSFETLPKTPDVKGECLKVLLVGSKTSALNCGYEIVDHAIVGRDDGETPVDIDLTSFGPNVKGVSRRHAEFRVKAAKLYIIDLGSSNGTYLKGKRIEAGNPVEVPNGSVLSFGALHVKVQIFD